MSIETKNLARVAMIPTPTESLMLEKAMKAKRPKIATNLDVGSITLRVPVSAVPFRSVKCSVTHWKSTGTAMNGHQPVPSSNHLALPGDFPTV